MSQESEEDDKLADLVARQLCFDEETDDDEMLGIADEAVQHELPEFRRKMPCAIDAATHALVKYAASKDAPSKLQKRGKMPSKAKNANASVIQDPHERVRVADRILETTLQRNKTVASRARHA